MGSVTNELRPEGEFWFQICSKPRPVLRHKVLGIDLQLSELHFDSEVELKRQLELIQRRQACRSVGHVAILWCHACQVNQHPFRATVKVWVQRTVSRLPQVRLDSNSGSKVLHQSLLGFREISRTWGDDFHVNAYMIGLDIKGDTKVWLNSYFEESRPQTIREQQFLCKQNQLVQEIVVAVSSSVEGGMPFLAEFNEYFSFENLLKCTSV